MNCAAALEVMLDADPSELAGLGTTPLTAHLATCGRCRAVADRLVVETRLLAVSVPPSGARGRMRRGVPGWVGRSLVPVGLVAALFLALTQRGPDMPVNATAGAASSLPDDAGPDSSVLPRAVATLPITVRRPASIRAYPPPVPVAAVRINPPLRAAAAEGGAAVIVDPPAGQRVAVMRTSNPKLTVVWLY